MTFHASLSLMPGRIEGRREESLLLAHVIWGEQSPFRIFLLTLYARHEVVFFRLTYRLMNTRIINNSLVKWLLAIRAPFRMRPLREPLSIGRIPHGLTKRKVDML